MSYFSIVLQQIILFVIYTIIGIIAVKCRLLDEDGLKVLSRLILRITIPIMLFTNTINGATRAEFLSALPVMAVTVVMYFFLYVIAAVLAKLMHMEGNDGNVFRASTMFGNIGFVGIPIISALFPERGMLYIALFTVIDQMVLWTVGKLLTSPVDDQKALTPAQVAGKMVNPSTIAIVLAVIFVLTECKLPALLNKGLTNVGGLTGVLAMIYMGGLFCYTDILSYLRRAEIYVEVIVKMILFPIAFDLFLRLFPIITQEVRVTMCILTALPTMTTVALFAKDQGSSGEYSAGMLFVNTVISMVSLPLICLWLGR